MQQNSFGLFKFMNSETFLNSQNLTFLPMAMPVTVRKYEQKKTRKQQNMHT